MICECYDMSLTGVQFNINKALQVWSLDWTYFVTCTHPLGRGDLAGVDHDEELHEVVIDLSTSSLDYVHILPSHTLPDLHAGLEVGELLGDNFA